MVFKIKSTLFIELLDVYPEYKEDRVCFKVLKTRFKWKNNASSNNCTMNTNKTNDMNNEKNRLYKKQTIEIGASLSRTRTIVRQGKCRGICRRTLSETKEIAFMAIIRLWGGRNSLHNIRFGGGFLRRYYLQISSTPRISRAYIQLLMGNTPANTPEINSNSSDWYTRIKFKKFMLVMIPIIDTIRFTRSRLE